MCSGCSGNYAGDFEESGDGVSESSFRKEPTWDGPKASESRLSNQGFGDFEDGLNARWSSSRMDLSGSGSENGAEIYEILISATHMVEIRVFAVNSQRMSERLENGSGNAFVA